MNEQFSKPKGFGEILDHTFRLVKNRFSDFFLILLILIGPIYLLQALTQLVSGKNLFREVGAGGNWLDQFVASFDQGAATTSSVGADLAFILLGLPHIILLAVAQVAILYMVNHIRKNEDYTVGSVIKKAFSRFWAILGSTLLNLLIWISIIVVPLIILIFIGVAGSFVDPIAGIGISIILFIALGLVIALLLIRWSFYLGVVAFGGDAPGLSRSWNLTRKRSWFLLGLYIILGLITAIIGSAVEIPVTLLLGNSVLYGVIINIVSIFTTIIFSVGYAIMYFDLRIRVNADDIKDMIDDYTEHK
ncbi:hypothetical protein LG329_17700 [Virgibacillus necropolis]|uniref:hypothetical protein n=1 Tax=Virgibacillus necropolis TaxID=163877 RepID=UPI003851717E